MRSSSRRYNAHHEHIPSDETDLAITYINHNDFGWKADVCKLQKHHAEYGAHCSKSHSINLAQVSNEDNKDIKKDQRVEIKSTTSNISEASKDKPVTIDLKATPKDVKPKKVD